MDSEPSLAVKVLSVPELFDLVQVYLTSNSDLVSLTQVSRTFNRFFGPLLWHTVEIKTERQHNRFVNTPEVHGAIRRHGPDWIRVIRLRTPRSLAPFLKPYINEAGDEEVVSLTQLHTVEFPWPRRYILEEAASSTLIRLPADEGLTEEDVEKMADPNAGSYYIDQQEHYHRARGDPKSRPAFLAAGIAHGFSLIPTRSSVDKSWFELTESFSWLQRRRMGVIKIGHDNTMIDSKTIQVAPNLYQVYKDLSILRKSQEIRARARNLLLYLDVLEGNPREQGKRGNSPPQVLLSPPAQSQAQEQAQMSKETLLKELREVYFSQHKVASALKYKVQLHILSASVPLLEQHELHALTSQEWKRAEVFESELSTRIAQLRNSLDKTKKVEPDQLQAEVAARLQEEQEQERVQLTEWTLQQRQLLQSTQALTPQQQQVLLQNQILLQHQQLRLQQGEPKYQEINFLRPVRQRPPQFITVQMRMQIQLQQHQQALLQRQQQLQQPQGLQPDPAVRPATSMTVTPRLLDEMSAYLFEQFDILSAKGEDISLESSLTMCKGNNVLSSPPSCPDPFMAPFQTTLTELLAQGSASPKTCGRLWDYFDAPSEVDKFLVTFLRQCCLSLQSFGSLETLRFGAELFLSEEEPSQLIQSQYASQATRQEYLYRQPKLEEAEYLISSAAARWSTPLGLRTLMIEGSLSRFDGVVWPRVVQRCAFLRSLHLNNTSDGLFREFSVIFSKANASPLLQELSLSGGRNTQDEELALFLEACSGFSNSAQNSRLGVTRLFLLNTAHFLTKSFEVLIRCYSKTLTHLSVHSCLGRLSLMIEQNSAANGTNLPWAAAQTHVGGMIPLVLVLSTFERLEVTDFFPSQRRFGPSATDPLHHFNNTYRTNHIGWFLDAQGLVHCYDEIMKDQTWTANLTPALSSGQFPVPWPCSMTLRVLKVLIGGAILTRKDNLGFEEPVRNQLLLKNTRKIFRILGSLISLEELHLGMDPPPVPFEVKAARDKDEELQNDRREQAMKLTKERSSAMLAGTTSTAALFSPLQANLPAPSCNTTISTTANITRSVNPTPASSSSSSSSSSVKTSSTSNSAITSAASSTDAATPIRGIVRRGDDLMCPVEVVSCSKQSEGVDGCCLPKMGLVVLTQQWIPGLGPKDEFTLHGLWPDTCDGGQGPATGCDAKRIYKDVETRIQKQSGGDDLLKEMNTYWSSYRGDNNQFWSHEWSKHGTCLSTLRPTCPAFASSGGDGGDNKDVFQYFTKTLELRSKYDLYKALAAKGILPGSTPDVKDMHAAIYDAFKFNAEINCRQGVLSESNHEYVLTETLDKGSCSGMISYPSKGAPTPAPAKPVSKPITNSAGSMDLPSGRR
ncbi:ribonuclease T2-like [Gryganskiella cystojenkinii]|nr:ribonuclease T2-like [Gryganskiella cystojenkinii]